MLFNLKKKSGKSTFQWAAVIYMSPERPDPIWKQVEKIPADELYKYTHTMLFFWL